jgi:hypothetical protein
MQKTLKIGHNSLIPKMKLLKKECKKTHFLVCAGPNV